eukprot:752399-Pyramimonas_sp.AAC.2
MPRWRLPLATVNGWRKSNVNNLWPCRTSIRQLLHLLIWQMLSLVNLPTGHFLRRNSSAASPGVWASWKPVVGAKVGLRGD